jgi:hypothetical protein
MTIDLPFIGMFALTCFVITVASHYAERHRHRG